MSFLLRKFPKTESVYIYIYLNHIVENHPSLKIKNSDVKLRKLVTPAKRIIISNACSSIPHDVLEKALEALGLSLRSPISTLKASINLEEYAHVESFRRQAFIRPLEEPMSLSFSFTVTWDGTTYRLFMAYDQPVCYTCKTQGHFAKYCPLLTQRNLEDTTSTNKTVSNGDDKKQTEAPLESEANSVNTTLTDFHTPDTIADTSTKVNVEVSNVLAQDDQIKKRPANFIEDSSPTSLPKKKFYKRRYLKRKNKKNCSSENLCELIEGELKSIEETMEREESRFTLSFDNLKQFLKVALGMSNPILEAEKYTNDIEGLRNMLFELYPHLRSMSIKNRFTRLINKLQTENRSSEESSHNSSEYEDEMVSSMTN